MGRPRNKFRGLLLVPNLRLDKLVWFLYIDDVLFLWTHGKETLSLVLEDLNDFHPNIKFSHEVNKEAFTF